MHPSSAAASTTCPGAATAHPAGQVLGDDISLTGGSSWCVTLHSLCRQHLLCQQASPKAHVQAHAPGGARALPVAAERAATGQEEGQVVSRLSGRQLCGLLRCSCFSAQHLSTKRAAGQCCGSCLRAEVARGMGWPERVRTFSNVESYKLSALAASLASMLSFAGVLLKHRREPATQARWAWQAGGGAAREQHADALELSLRCTHQPTARVFEHHLQQQRQC